MSDTVERVALPCPACSPDHETVHLVLAPGGHATVRCTACDHVHKEALPEEAAVARDVVVSQSGESVAARAEFDPEAELSVGDEFVVETDEGIFTVRVTSLQVGDQERVERAPAEAVRTVWTRAVGNVAVDVTVHPGEGSGGDSYSTTVHVPGDEQFAVGETVAYGEEEFTVEGVVVRDGAAGYEHDKLDREGDAVAAKDAKRVYARDQTSDAWSAW